MRKKIDNAYITLFVIALALCIMPIVLPKAGLALATEFCVVLTIALAWNLLGGFSGIILRLSRGPDFRSDRLFPAEGDTVGPRTRILCHQRAAGDRRHHLPA